MNVAATLDHVALVEKWLGNYDEALRMSLQSLAAHRRLGDVAGEALCLNNLADLHLARQDYASAGTYLREALAICDRMGLVGPRIYILANLTEVAMKDGDTAAAEGYAKRGVESASAVGNRAIVALLKLQFARLALLRGDLAGARAPSSPRRWRIAVALALSSLKSPAASCSRELLAAQGEVATARRVLAFVAGHPATERARFREEIRRAPARAARGRRPDRRPGPASNSTNSIHRIVGEADVAYAPLIAALRGAP